MQTISRFSIFTTALLSLSVGSIGAQTIAAQRSLTRAVSEGVSSSLDPVALAHKYRPLAQALGKAVGQDIVVSPVRDFETLEQGLKKDEYDIAMARPTDYMGRGVRDYGYSLVAIAKPDSQCLFLVEKSSLLNKVEDIKGRRISAPGKAAYMTKLCGAELRDRGIDIKNEQVKHAADQVLVGMAVKDKLADVGFVGSFSSIGKNWEKSGQRILHKTAPQPFFPVIASKRISADQMAKIRKVLTDLETTEEGRKILSGIGVEGYNVESKDRLMKLLKWLEKA